MTIAAADLRFLSSERMNDVLSTVSIPNEGGGLAVGPVVLTGVPNSVFPAAMPADLVTGRRQLRLLYPAVLSDENNLASNAQVAVYQRAADANVSLFAMAAQQLPNTPGFQQRLSIAAQTIDRAYLADAGIYAATLVSAGGNALSGLSYSPSSLFNVGDKVGIATAAGVGLAAWRTLTAVDSGAGTMTFAGAGLTGYPAGHPLFVYRYGAPVSAVAPLVPQRFSAPGHLTAGVAAGVQQVVLDRLEVRLLPVGASAATPGIALPSPPPPAVSFPAARTVQDLGGVMPAFWPGWPVLIDDPTNGTAPEVRVVESVNYLTGVVRFTTPLANAYTTGSRVSTLLDLGNLQATVALPAFSQQTWNRTWADAPTGPTMAARYTGAIAMNNAGGTTDRWALVFSSGTNFSLISERLGQIGAGNIASNFVPLNPLTSQPYFTVPASGWGTGWLPGNAVRFNTQGAHAGVWYGRCISPGAAGADEGGLIFRADV
jgi:hypothetical protein